MDKPKQSELLENEISDVQVALDFLANAADCCIDRLDNTADSNFEYKAALKYISCARGELGSLLTTLQTKRFGQEVAKMQNLRPKQRVELNKE